MKFKPHIIPLCSIFISIIIGVICNDYFIGTITLICGFLNSYYAAIGKWQNYIYSIGFNIFYAYVCAINGLFGFLIFTLFVYMPIQIYGLINWLKNKNQEQNIINMKSLKLKHAILFCIAVFVLSLTLGFLLNLIPKQNLAFWDSTSQIINICGMTAQSLRFREAWYTSLANNTIDVIIWIMIAIKQTPNSAMMLITNIVYLVMNIIGIFCWIKLEKQQNEQNNNIISFRNTNSNLNKT